MLQVKVSDFTSFLKASSILDLKPQICWRSIQAVDVEVLFKHPIADENGSQMLEGLEGNSGMGKQGHKHKRCTQKQQNPAKTLGKSTN